MYTDPNRSGVLVNYKRILVHEFTRPHKFANDFWVLISTITLRVAEMLLRRGSEQDWLQYCILGHEENNALRRGPEFDRMFYSNSEFKN